MPQQSQPKIPATFTALLAKSEAVGFTMPADVHVGSLLRSLVASKPAANALELGTGMGLSLAWIVDGLPADGHLISLDNDETLIGLVDPFFSEDERVDIICTDGSQWLRDYTGPAFDLIFADTWPGKYNELEKALSLVKPGGFYVIDDMTEQDNWPEGHAEKARRLEAYLESRADFILTRMNWSTGVILMTRIG